jgi:hypothetical protein
LSDRSARPFGGWNAWHNPLLLLCLAAALSLQLLALYLPALRSLLAMTAFTPPDWLGILSASAGSVLAVELSKMAWVRWERAPQPAAPGDGR